MKIVSYRNYRKFLFDFVGVSSGGVDGFSSRIGHVLGRNALYKIISRDRSGEFKRKYFVSLDSWAELLSRLRINQKDLTHLLLLHIEESLDEKKLSSDKAVRAIKRLIRLNSYTWVDDKKLSPAGYSFAKIYDGLPRSIQKKIVLEVEQNMTLYLNNSDSRQRRARLEALLAELG